MAASEEIHALLDRHLGVLTDLGSPAAQRLGDPIPTETVREQLESHGYATRDDVIGFFSWRTYKPLTTPMESRATLFWEYFHPISLEEAIEVYRMNREIVIDVAPEWEDSQDSFPGPPHLLPVATWDLVGWTAVDSRHDPDGGRAIRCDQSSDVRPIFASLAEAISTATYCLEVGLWTVAADGSIEKT